jgi:hypothetical protein
MLRKHNPAATNDDDDSLGLTALFSETETNTDTETDELAGLKELFSEKDESTDQHAQPHIHIIQIDPLDLLSLLKLGMTTDSALVSLMLLGIGKRYTISVNDSVNKQEDQAAKQREVDKISSHLLAKNGLFRCPQGGDHLHRASDTSVYRGPLPKEENEASKNESYGSFFSTLDSDSPTSSLGFSSDSGDEWDSIPLLGRQFI